MATKKKKSSFAKEKMPFVEVLLKASITFFFAVVFLVFFFIFGGLHFFESSVFVGAVSGYDFQVHVIDVGNGDAFIIKLPGNKTMLIDSGEQKYQDRVLSYLNQYMRAEGINQIDYFVLTHSDSDHVGNAAKIIEEHNVQILYRPTKYAAEEYTYTSLNGNYAVDEGTSYNSAIVAAYKKGCEIRFSQSELQLDFENCKIKFLSPMQTTYPEDNNYSAVLMIEYYGSRFLFMGDAEKDVENALIAKYGDALKADVLKLGHHGSKSSTSQAFLDVVSPTYAILSCSDNSSILPSGEVVERVEKAGCQILSTHKLENFALTVNQNKIQCFAQQREFNYFAVIFALLLVGDLVVWKLPFSRKKAAQKS